MTAPLSIAVVEDNDDMREQLVELMRARGHRVVAAANAEALADAAAEVELFVIDLTLPGEDGLSLTRRLRASYPQVGIVIVTARRKTGDRISGYDHGADMCLSKPIVPAELCAAVDALARRLPAAVAARAATAVTLDTVRLRLVGPLASVEVTSSEAALVEALIWAPRRQLGLPRVAELLGQNPSAPNKSRLYVCIVRLRRKLVDAGVPGSAIKAVRGGGYQLSDTPVLP